MDITSDLKNQTKIISYYLPSKERLALGSLAIASSFYLGGPVGAVSLGATYWATRKIIGETALVNNVQIGDVSKYRNSEFCKRISNSGWNSILKTIESLNHIVTNEELKIFYSGEWTHPIFRNKDWIYFAFHAYLQDKLNINTMCRLFLYNACQKQTEKDSRGEEKGLLERIARAPGLYQTFYPEGSKRMKTFQLYDANGTIDPQARERLKVSTETYLKTEERRKKLFELLSHLPPEETQFFAIEEKGDRLLDSIAAVGFRLFIASENSSCIKGCKSRWQTVASPLFTEQVHKARSSENAMTQIPILGYSERERLSNPTGRIVFMPSFVSAPKRVHNVRCTQLAMNYHDTAYHHAIEASNPDRLTWIAVAFFFKEKGKLWIVPRLLDRELTNYLYSGEKAEEFWQSLAYSCKANARLGVPLEEYPLVDSFIPIVAEFFHKRGAEFDLDLKALESLIKKIKDSDLEFLTKLHDEIMEGFPKESC